MHLVAKIWVFSRHSPSQTPCGRDKFAKLPVCTSAYASLPYMAVRANTHPCAPVRTYPHPYTPVHTLTDGCGRVRTSCTAVYCCVLLCTAASEAVPAASQSGGAGVNCVRECPGRPPGASPALKCKIQKSLFFQENRTGVARIGTPPLSGLLIPRSWVRIVFRVPMNTYPTPHSG